MACGVAVHEALEHHFDLDLPDSEPLSHVGRDWRGACISTCASSSATTAVYTFRTFIGRMPSLLTFLDVSLGCLVLYMIQQLLTRTAVAGRYPPGPKPLPLVGNLLDMPTTQHWFTFMRWGDTYGLFNQLTLRRNILKAYCRGCHVGHRVRAAYRHPELHTSRC